MFSPIQLFGSSHRLRHRLFGGTIVRKILACAAVLAGLTATAHAADLSVDSVKDALPSVPDGPLSWHGVTFYGTIDVGYAYQTNGRPLGYIVSDLEYMPFGLVTRNLTGQSQSTLTANALEQSKIGLKIEEDIGYGLQAVGRLDTGFDPMTGELDDGCKSLLVNSGIPYAKQTSNSDSARCGQAFNNVAYGGLSSPLYGTLTVGRQFSLQLDTLGAYDPMALSYAFSVLGYSGAAAGMGSTQATRWDELGEIRLCVRPVPCRGYVLRWRQFDRHVRQRLRSKCWLHLSWFLRGRRMDRGTWRR